MDSWVTRLPSSDSIKAEFFTALVCPGAGVNQDRRTQRPADIFAQVPARIRFFNGCVDDVQNVAILAAMLIRDAH